MERHFFYPELEDYKITIYSDFCAVVKELLVFDTIKHISKTGDITCCFTLPSSEYIEGLPTFESLNTDPTAQKNKTNKILSVSYLSNNKNILEAELNNLKMNQEMVNIVIKTDNAYPNSNVKGVIISCYGGVLKILSKGSDNEDVITLILLDRILSIESVHPFIKTEDASKSKAILLMRNTKNEKIHVESKYILKNIGWEIEFHLKFSSEIDYIEKRPIHVEKSKKNGGLIFKTCLLKIVSQIINNLPMTIIPNIIELKGDSYMKNKMVDQNEYYPIMEKKMGNNENESLMAAPRSGGSGNRKTSTYSNVNNTEDGSIQENYKEDMIIRLNRDDDTIDMEDNHNNDTIKNDKKRLIVKSRELLFESDFSKRFLDIDRKSPKTHSSSTLHPNSTKTHVITKNIKVGLTYFILFDNTSKELFNAIRVDLKKPLPYGGSLLVKDESTDKEYKTHIDPGYNQTVFLIRLSKQDRYLAIKESIGYTNGKDTDRPDKENSTINMEYEITNYFKIPRIIVFLQKMPLYNADSKLKIITGNVEHYIQDWTLYNEKPINKTIAIIVNIKGDSVVTFKYQKTTYT